MRRSFASGLMAGLQIVWPVLSVLLGLIVVQGLAVGVLEGWSVQDAVYFGFITALTIGYGDLVPTLLVTRTLAVLIGACGVLFTALVAAVAVRALTHAHDNLPRPDSDAAA